MYNHLPLTHTTSHLIYRIPIYPECLGYFVRVCVRQQLRDLLVPFSRQIPCPIPVHPNTSAMNNGYSSEDECCLIEDGQRCKHPAGYASYNARIEKTVTQRRLRLTADNTARHQRICDFHKNRIQSVRSKRRRRKDSEDSNENESDSELMMPTPKVDLVQLQMNTLRRYKRHYKVSARQGLNKPQLAEVILFLF